MTTEEANNIFKLHKEGLSYRAIAKKLNISEGTVYSFLRRNPNYEIKGICRFCGNEMKPQVGNRTKHFCSNKCRMNYWNKHKKVAGRGSNKECTCLHCQTSFIDFGNRKRKFCSRGCYLEHRYGKAPTEKDGN